MSAGERIAGCIQEALFCEKPSVPYLRVFLPVSCAYLLPAAGELPRLAEDGCAVRAENAVCHGNLLFWAAVYNI